MDRKFARKWSSRNITIKVTNMNGGRVDIHRNISREEAAWIECNPNLKVEVLEMKFFKKKDV